MTADASTSLTTPARGGLPGGAGGMDSPRKGAEPSPRASTDTGKLVLPSYERPAGLHPPLDFNGYRSTALRHPKQPLVLLPHRLTEVTGPLLGGDFDYPDRFRPDRAARWRASGAADHPDGAGAGLGRAARARYADRDLADERGRALPAFASITPRRSTRTSRDRAGHHRLGGPVPVRHHRAGRLPVGKSPQRLAARAHPLLAVRARVHPAARYPDVLPRRPAAAARPDLQLGARRKPGSG